ncbi:MAG TPA: penicillin-binding protein activator [Methylococcus sp.]|nr:penicillin-binding protein activator [Methylococcus sp.]
MPSVTRIGILALSALLAACAVTRPSEDDPASGLSLRAQERLRMGDFSGAAQIYEQAGDVSWVPDYFRLRSADAYLRAGDHLAARRLLRAVDPKRLDRDDENLYQLLGARIDLNVGRAREAMAKLDDLDYAALSPSQRWHYHTLRASAYNQLGNMLESARERIAAGPLLTSEEAVQKNNEAIFDALNRLPDAALRETPAAPSSVLNGWLTLVRLIRETPPIQRGEALAAWRARFPGHPAAGSFLDGLSLSDRDSGAVGTVQVKPVNPVKPPAPAVTAVLLPLSGPYRPLAEAIRAGIEAAQRADENPDKPILRFYDTQAAEVPELYRKAVAEGATQVLGPLLKEEVATLAKGGELTVPVLALNEVPGVSTKHLFQFGLTPEQEVDQLASRAWFDGRRVALVIVPASAYGQRIQSRFSETWRRLGGTVAAIKTYAPGSGDYSSALSDTVMLVGATTSPQGTPPRLASSTPDLILLAANERDTRIIKPYLESLGVKLSIYAMSSFFNGRFTPGLDQDLDGLIFCDIPWVLDESEGGALSARSLANQVQQTPPDSRKLIALGIDAYRLTRRLEELETHPSEGFRGVTGMLTVSEDRRVKRQLACARIDQGAPTGIELAPAPPQ